MITTARYRTFGLRLLFTLFLLSLVIPQAYAQRNVCDECQAINEADSVRCKDCLTPLNKCLDCNTENPANLDYCSQCNAPLAEMRVLGTIDESTREELKLGQSQRAIAEKELLKIAYLLEKQPEQSEKLLYQRSKLLNSMSFYSREAESWREFLQKFPESRKKSSAKVFLAEALRKWAYLFYQQKDNTSALALLNEAVETNPASAESWGWLGRIYYETGKKKKAGEAYLKALEAQPGNANYIHFLRQLRVQIPEQLRQANK